MCMNMSYLCVCVWHCCNSEVNSGFFYKSAGEREKLVAAERKFVDDRVMQVITLKKKVHVTYYHPKDAHVPNSVIIY